MKLIRRGDVRPYPPDGVDGWSWYWRGTERFPFLRGIMVAPVTTVIRGLPSEVPLSKDFGLDAPAAVNLDAVMTVSRFRLGELAGRLGGEELSKVCAALQVAVGCDAEDCGGEWTS